MAEWVNTGVEHQTWIARARKSTKKASCPLAARLALPVPSWTYDAVAKSGGRGGVPSTAGATGSPRAASARGAHATLSLIVHAWCTDGAGQRLHWVSQPLPFPAMPASAENNVRVPAADRAVTTLPRTNALARPDSARIGPAPRGEGGRCQQCPLAGRARPCSALLASTPACVAPAARGLEGPGRGRRGDHLSLKGLARRGRAHHSATVAPAWPRRSPGCGTLSNLYPVRWNPLLSGGMTIAIRKPTRNSVPGQLPGAEG